ncbi:hypothetical protein GOP47_0011175 [Adiantum capillus-veneris]|uniref:Uncharacterized protein n=1 Tax=Adiantum capillus-veneris TaxID=13818 RepID=A0A9D4ZGG9_ADICA|nr:hypothetical protein GOP47_0011175 [Adiantum capillus-veneris]
MEGAAVKKVGSVRLEAAEAYMNEHDNNGDVKAGAVDFRGRPAVKSKTGGWKAVPFLLVLQVCEVAAFAGLGTNIVTYLLQEAHFQYSDAATTTTNVLGTSYTMPLIAGFFADAYLGRFHSVILYGVVEILGFVLLTILSSVPSLRKTPPCISATVCPQVRGTPYSILMAGMYLVGLGSGGLRVNLSSHGGDQFDESDPKERLGMSSFFNWFFFCLALGFGIASTFLVYIQEYVNFALGFGLSIALLFIGLSAALVGSRVYRFEVPIGSPLTRIAQVIVAAFRNQQQRLPSSPLGLYEVYEKEGSAHHIAHIPHTDQYKCLDKAAVLESIENKGNPWKLCTVTQVEEVKALLRMMPIWATTIMLNVCLAQLLTFSIEQGVTTDRTLGSIQIPAASLVTVPVLMLIIASPLYEMAFVPLVRKFTGRPTGITYLQRIGVGLFMAVVSMTIAGAVERRRVRIAAENGLLDNPNVLLGLESIPMSVFWLVPQYLAFGIADLFTYVGVLEFFYHEAPDGMRSLGTGISQSTLALGYFLSTTIVNIVKHATGHGSSGGWLPANLNRSRLDYFYWMLAVINLLNFVLFQICAYYYRYRPRSASVSHHYNPNDVGSFTEDAFLPPTATPPTPSPIHNAS